MKNTNILILIGVIVVVLLGIFIYKNNKSLNMSDIGMRQRFSEDEFEKNTGNRKDVSNRDEKGTGMGKNISKGNCLADDCLVVDSLNYPVGDLTENAKTSLLKALDDEYKAYATYNSIITKFGNIRPFIMIIRAEEQHISSLKSLLDKYGIAIPENTYINKIVAPQTLQEACSLGVTAELDNAALYQNTLLPTVTSYEDITRVFTNLMNASQEKHLPAFQNCLN